MDCGEGTKYGREVFWYLLPGFSSALRFILILGTKKP